MCTTSPLCRVFPAVAEFCSLRFDEVDTTEQMGLTCRMLATLKSFAHDVTYWEEGVKIDEPAFTLLGLDEVAQFALLRTAERAAALVDERCWREAYQALCAARPWVSSEPDSGPAQEQRAGAEAELARVEARARRESGEPRGPPRTGPCGGSAAGGPPAAGSVAVVVRLPAGGAGRVLGPHAATVTALQAETGARVWLDRASDEAHVSGTPEAVEAVRRGIRFLLTPVRGEDRGRHVAQARAAALEEGVRPDHVPVLPERHLQQGQRVPFPARARPAEQRRRGDARQHRRRAARRHQREEQQGRGQGRSAGPPSHGLGRRQASEGRRRFGKPERDLAGECPDVAYRVQSHSELSWTCVPCGGGGASRRRRSPSATTRPPGCTGWAPRGPTSRCARAPTAWTGTRRGTRSRSRPAFSWLRQQRRHLAPA
ncbi:unnamed protein product [Prorocentrum cordatum]|uniref:K Homology domain-containing protein n=1 Tax=Prorocentrum cordatum TaxID=2364126 RepID=A0ABN9VCE7_9DINO|nr:unnamed protein product [Polarella glacialis]